MSVSKAKRTMGDPDIDSVSFLRRSSSDNKDGEIIPKRSGPFHKVSLLRSKSDDGLQLTIIY